ncbi:serine hydrolase domain-containing protein [Nocardioides taihuensis]|uniref:Serine hydrolase domain-containing protein n=1 Tax=Nocardioides taihuensis TaxID=1835606 RepID=A0ABW0BEB7_9ACTN
MTAETEPDGRPMCVDPRFQTTADRFFDTFRTTAHGGGAAAAYLHGELVLDVWAGWRAKDLRWTHDTVTMCFSTGKGVASTVLHRLADRGLVDYDQPVAAYWPEFAAAGKDRITVRELMSHRAGLHNVRAIAPTREILLDNDAFANALAAGSPDPRRFRGPGYHAVTYGNLVAEVAARVTGKDFTTLLREEVAEPLGVDEFWFHVPLDHRVRIARVFPTVKPGPLPWSTTGRLLSAVPGLRAVAEAGMAAGFDELVRSPEAHDAVMPGWNGVFSAEALAKMYVALANGGVVDAKRYLSADRIRQMAQVQTRDRDYVLGIRPNWRLGYHPAWLRIPEPPLGSIGHYGFGGSGAWADPETGLSFAFVSNRLGNALQPITDGRMSRIGGAAIEAARRAA